jgi:hypothetical protein
VPLVFGLWVLSGLPSDGSLPSRGGLAAEWDPELPGIFRIYGFLAKFMRFVCVFGLIGDCWADI